MTGARYETTPVAWSLPAIQGVVFSTAEGDKAFLAALKRERPKAHATTASARVQARTRLRTIAQPLQGNGTCPCCGTRLAFGCEHQPLQGGAA